MGVQLAKAMGMRVIGVDEGCEEEAVHEAGLRGVLGFTKVKDVAEEAMRVTDEKGAGVFVTATSNVSYDAAPEMVRVARRVMCVGLRK